MKYASQHQDLQIFVLQLNQSNFQPLEVVGRGSETQLQVAENLLKQDKGGNLNKNVVCVINTTEQILCLIPIGKGKTQYLLVKICR